MQIFKRDSESPKLQTSSWTDETEGQQDRGVAMESEAGALHGNWVGGKGAQRSWCVGWRTVSPELAERMNQTITNTKAHDAGVI